MPANAPVAGTRSFSAVRFVREDNSEYQTPVYFVPSDTAGASLYLSCLPFGDICLWVL